MPVLLPGADIGRDALAKGLSGFGAQVERVAAYRTVPATGIAGRAQDALRQGIDIVTFTSSSTVRNLMGLLNGDKGALELSKIACIGPTTEATARELGLRVDMVASPHTVDGLVNTLVAYFGRT